MKIRDFSAPDTRPLLVKAADYRNSREDSYMPPITLGRPKAKSKEARRVMAMDACVKNVLSGIQDELSYMAMPKFLGYAMLSNISQEALIRAGVETIADEMTRKFVEWTYDDDDGNDAEKKEKLITEMQQQSEKYKLKEVFNDALVKDGNFGGCLIYIDVGDLDDEEAAEPLVLKKETFKKGSFRGFKVIEPINIYPGSYNTSDPTSKDYFKPEYWYILGRRYHASRFIYIASNEAPLLLKPAYNFFGIPRAQLALDYVAQFVANRESAQELLNKFSLTCWKTNMGQELQGKSLGDLTNRAKLFNKMKHNSGVMLLDKETEDMVQINTPLGGVREIVEMSLNLLTAVWRIPKIKYLGEGEGGLNASSVEQMRSFYDFILSQKEKVLTQPMETVLKIFQLNLGYDINEALGFKFPSLVEMDESERANLNKLQADRDNIYLAAGVLSQEEVRQRLSMDKDSGYSMIDIDKVPEMPEEPLKDAEKVDSDEEDRIAADMAMDDRWITIGHKDADENGEGGRKGRHIHLDDGETPEEAIEELKDNDNKKPDKQEKENKEQKEVEEKNKTEKEPVKSEKASGQKAVKEMTDVELETKEEELRDKVLKYKTDKDNFIKDNEEYKKLLEEYNITANRFYQTPYSNEDLKKELKDKKDGLSGRLVDKQDELEYEFDKKNVDKLREYNEKIEEIRLEKAARLEYGKEDIRKRVKELNDEQLDNRRIVLNRHKVDVESKIKDKLYDDEKYISLKNEYNKLRSEKEAMGYNLSEEEYKKKVALERKMSDLNSEIDSMIRKNIAEQSSETREIDKELSIINEERTERYEKRKKEEKERFEKEREEKAQKGRQIAKDNYYPKTIAGVARGKEMSVEEADSGNPNPRFNSGESGYGINCQSCVVCYEARLRGYDVTTKPNKRGSKLAVLARGTNKAWIDPETGLEPEYITPDTSVKNSAKYYKFLEDTIEKGKRYNLGFAWKGRRRTGHIVSIIRGNDGLEIYDPQSGKKYVGDELKNYLGRISYRTTIKSVVAGQAWGPIKEVSSVELLRVDNLAFNPEFMNDIMEKKQ